MLEQVPLGPDEHPANPHPYLSGNFAPLPPHRTLPLTPCAFSGALPPELAGGQYVRNGGNPLVLGPRGSDAHWFDGDGMLSGVLFRRIPQSSGHGFSVRPEFVNQFLVTDVFAYAEARSRRNRGRSRLRTPVLPSMTTLVNPCTSAVRLLWVVVRTVLIVTVSHLFYRRRKRAGAAIAKISVANTALVYHDGRALATCESGPPLRFALPGLQTIGWFNGWTAEGEPQPQSQDRVGVPADGGARFGGDGTLGFMKEWTTAHPRVDAVTGELVAFHMTFVAPFVYYSVLPPADTPAASEKPQPLLVPRARFNAPVPGVATPKLMHDFGVSRRHTVIVDCPLSLDPRNLLQGRPVLSYDAAAPARFGLFPRHRPDAVRWFDTRACCIFHTANTWDSAHHVHMLACRLTSASLVFSAGNLPTPAAGAVPPGYLTEKEDEQCRLYYYCFPLHDNAVSGRPTIRHQWALSTIPFEFPVLHPAKAMVSARFVFGCSTSNVSYTVALGKASKIDYLAKMDVQRLIAQGVADPPEAVRGCVDCRTINTILAENRADDPIQIFALPEGHFAQEPRFVPRDAESLSGEAEDDGWLLTYVFDEKTNLDQRGHCRPGAFSELWVIDARDMRTVVARVRLPLRVPYGLHGQWFSEREIASQRAWESLREVGAWDEARGWTDGVREMIERWLG